jgi:hypothetical protein
VTVRDYLSVLSGIVILIAFAPFIMAIVRGRAKPRKVTWLVWATGDWIILGGMIASETISGLIAAACLGATTIFLLSLRYGEKGWEARDVVCLCLSALAIALWQYFGESSLGIAFSCLSLMIAAWPTYVSAYYRPENEDRLTWIIFNVSSLLGVLAISHLTFADIAPPVVFLVIDLPMLWLLFVRPFQRYRRAQLI